MIGKEITSHFPKKSRMKNGSTLDIRVMKREDNKILHEFYEKIPKEDREYSRVNIFETEDSENWLKRIEAGTSMTLLGFVQNDLAGIVSLHQDLAKGSQHIAYIRLNVSPAHRKVGIGVMLSQEIYSIALCSNLEKVYVEVLSNQREVWELFSRKLDFKEEAVLKDHVKDEKGKNFDLVILSNSPAHIIEEIQKQMSSDSLHSYDH